MKFHRIVIEADVEKTELLMKNKNSQIFENILTEIQNVPWLSPLWSVIYYEAIRENHLLFKKSEIEEFNSKLASTPSRDVYCQLANHPRLEVLTFDLLCCSDLGSMLSKLEKEDRETKFVFFAYYIRTLDIIKKELKTNHH